MLIVPWGVPERSRRINTPHYARFRAILIPGRVKRQAVAKPQTCQVAQPLEVKTLAVNRKNPVTDVANFTWKFRGPVAGIDRFQQTGGM
jgi:hypothetical protein